MTINLGAFAPIDSVRLEIRQPDGVTGTGWFVDVLSSAHEKAVAYSTASTNRSLRRQAQLEAQQANGRKVKPEERTPDEVRAENLAFVASRLGGWDPITVPELGGDLPFSDENVVRLLGLPKYGWVYLQIIEFLGDERNFTPASAKT